jgi:hypothetical protein
MPTILQDNGDRLIVRNVRTVDASGISATRSRSATRTRRTYECWTGEAWSHQRHFGLKFKSAEEATEYLTAHQDLIEATE